MQVMQFLIDFCTVFNGMVCNEVQRRRFPQLEAMKQFSPQEYGVASALGNDELAAEIDRVIGEMNADGRMAALQQKWGL